MSRCATQGRGLLCFRTTACYYLIFKHLTISKSIQNNGRHNQAGNCILRSPYTNNNTSVKHQTVDEAYNIQQNINSKNKGEGERINEREKGDVFEPGN